MTRTRIDRILEEIVLIGGQDFATGLVAIEELAKGYDRSALYRLDCA